MPEKKTLSLGPLPPEKEDYSNYEEVDILWGRISAAALVVALMIGGVGYFVGSDPGTDAGVASVDLEQAPESSTTEVQATYSDSLPEPTGDNINEKEPVVAAMEMTMPATEVSQKQPLAAELDNEPAQDSATEPDQPELAEDLTVKTDEDSSTKIEPMNTTVMPAPVSVITTLHTGIQSAVLSSAVDENKKPVDALGYDVKMNSDGLIKVVLYTDLTGLNGTTLYHEWVLEDEQQARVRIPVRSETQSSYSSKYIDRNMLGDWTVKVRDENGDMYALAQFRVQAQ